MRDKRWNTEIPEHRVIECVKMRARACTKVHRFNMKGEIEPLISAIVFAVIYVSVSV